MSFLSSQVPVCAPASAPVSIAAALADGSVFPEVGQKIVAGQVTGFVSAFNGQSRRVDVFSRAFGLFAVISGLAISAGTGLSLNVATGYALIDGVLEVAAQAYVVPASQARVWIWVKQDKTVVHTLTATAPSAKSLYIGSVVTSGSAITSVDSVDGVQCLKGGIVYRATSDTGIPDASGPSGQVMVAKTLGGTFLWNGAAWCVLQKTGIVYTDASSVFSLSSTTQGFLAPRMTGIQRDAISSPAEGLMIYNLTTHKMQVWDGSAWQNCW
jgi:hypothetical protein